MPGRVRADRLENYGRYLKKRRVRIADCQSKNEYRAYTQWRDRNNYRQGLPLAKQEKPALPAGYRAPRAPRPQKTYPINPVAFDPSAIEWWEVAPANFQKLFKLAWYTIDLGTENRFRIFEMVTQWLSPAMPVKRRSKLASPADDFAQAYNELAELVLKVPRKVLVYIASVVFP